MTLTEWKKDFKEYIDALMLPRDDYRGIMEYIDEVPVADGQWIPCSERLPEKVGRYLVTCEKWGAWAVDWNIWVGEPKSWLWEQGVTAWMPLPEPYREDGDNDA